MAAATRQSKGQQIMLQGMVDHSNVTSRSRISV